MNTKQGYLHKQALLLSYSWVTAPSPSVALVHKWQSKQQQGWLELLQLCILCV